jgi:hypothetical protein
MGLIVRHKPDEFRSTDNWACDPRIPDDVPLTSKLVRWLVGDGEDCEGLNRLQHVGPGAC